MTVPVPQTGSVRPLWLLAGLLPAIVGIPFVPLMLFFSSSLWHILYLTVRDSHSTA
jgi:hypothetical protein